MPATMIPENVRKIMYTVFAVIGAAFTATFASYGAIPGTGAPDWLIRSFAAYSALCAAFGAVAANNTGQRKDEDPAPPQNADLDDDEPADLPVADAGPRLS